MRHPDRALRCSVVLGVTWLALALTALPAAAVCGDGVVDAAESCDGEQDCTTSCTVAIPSMLKCYKAKQPRGEGIVRQSVAVIDSFSADPAELIKLSVHCAAAVEVPPLGSIVLPDLADGAHCYRARRPRPAPAQVQMTDQFGVLDLDIVKPTSVCTVTSDASNYRHTRTLGEVPFVMASLGDDIVGTIFRSTAFRYDGTTGAHVVEYPPPPGVDPFAVGYGWAVAASGTRVYVAAPVAGGDGEVFVFDAASGAHLQTIANPGAAPIMGYNHAAVVGPFLAVGGDRAFNINGIDVLIFDATTGVFQRTIPVESYTDLTDVDGQLGIGAPFIGGGGSAFLVDPATGSVTTSFKAKGLGAEDFFGGDLAHAGGLVFAGAQGDDRIADFSGAVHVFDTATGENTTTVRNGRAHDDSAALFGRMVVGLGSRVAVAGFGGVSGVYEASARMELLQVPGRFNSRQSNAPDSSTIGANGRLYAPFGEVFEDLCGDGLVGIGEECDDGNVASGDGCSGSCRVESHAGWSCYKVRSGTAFVQPANVEIGTRIESERVTRVIKPAELCVPAGIGGGVPDPQAPALMCYKVKHARGEIKTPKTVFRFRDRFGEPVATVFKEKTLCVEATLS